MIVLIVFTLILVLTLLSKIKTGTLYNPVFFFNVWWGIWVIISNFGFMGLNIPNNRTYIIIIISMLMFSTGCLFIIKKPEFEKINMNQEVAGSIKIKIKILIMSQIIILIILIPFLQKSLKIIPNMEPSKYRIAIYDTNILYGSDIFRFAINYLAQPLILTSLLVGTAGFLLGNKKLRTLFLLSSLNGVVFSLMTLGRWYFLRIIFFLVLGYFFLQIFKKVLSRNDIKFIKNKKFIYTTIMLSISSLVVMSKFRGNNSSSIMDIVNEYLIKYFTGSFIAFDKFINENHDLAFIPYQFGRVTFSGLDEIFIVILRKFDDTIVNIKYYTGPYTSEFINIGDGVTYNAFYTSIFNFYLDGGLLGVILMSFVFGAIIGKVFNTYLKSPNIFNLALLIYLVYLSLVSSLRWELQSPMYWFVFLLLFMFITNFKFNNINKYKKSN